MQIGSLHIIAPALGTTPIHSEAEVFGQVTWLWMRTPRYRDLPIKALAEVVLPPLKAQQFILATSLQDGQMQPVAYIAWANFSADAERRYLNDPASLLATDWSSGDRMWVTEWFAPFGHTAEFSRLVRRVLPDTCWRTLQHRGNERGLRILHFRGDQVSAAQNRAWWGERQMITAASATKTATEFAAIVTTTFTQHLPQEVHS